jgi:ubiquinone/menaquinone biosynthesis C-methylase UbiE
MSDFSSSEVAASGESASREYLWTGSTEAQTAFGRRSALADLPFLLPHLAAGMRVVDFGCGTGSITLDIADVVSPGEVIGFDVDDAVIERARTAAATRGLANVTFLVADALQPRLEQQRFDVAIFSGVLAYLLDPNGVLRQAHSLLAPGGVIAIREMQKSGDWFGGPYSSTVAQVNQLLVEDIKYAGGDPFVGRRLAELLTEGGFIDIECSPSVSLALSVPSVIGRVFANRLRDSAFGERTVKHGLESQQRLERMLPELDYWAHSPMSIVAIAESIALARKA